MQGKVVVITGARSGCDLSRMSEVQRLAAQIAQVEPRIDVLINNAGALFGSRRMSEDGLELTFATNHMAYFVLTNGLCERLLASPARIVNTASDAHRGRRLDFDDLQSARNFSPLEAYGRSKLCNILFTRELSRRCTGKGITANCLHPGFVATRFGDGGGRLLSRAVRLAKIFAISPEQGAKTIVYRDSAPVRVDLSDLSYRDHRALPTAVARAALHNAARGPYKRTGGAINHDGLMTSAVCKEQCHGS
jgi:NAD(P)-dependent dehydrogenase (short-subunit alcohol dehydrogenase family)